MRIGVLGLGYVGIVSAVCLARSGHTVVGVDADPLKLERIAKGTSPVVEPGIDHLLRQGLDSGRLSVAASAGAAVESTDLSLVCVGTPGQPDGTPSLDQVLRVARQIGAALRAKTDYHGVVIRSTVLPGTVDQVADVLAKASGGCHGIDFGVAANPEFMREGLSIHDFENPVFTVVGTTDQRLARTLADLYEAVDAPFHHVAPHEAEMLKFACNAFHALKVTFANEIGAICKRVGVDSHRVMELFCSDTKLNVSPSYLRPGFAFGGSCLPKDLRAIVGEAERLGASAPMLASILPSNDRQIEQVAGMILETGHQRIGVLGLSFKAGTDDLRESPMLRVVGRLIAAGCDVAAYDPNIDVAKLIGANKTYVERKILEPSRLMRADSQAVIDHAEVIVVGNAAPGFRKALDRVRPDQLIYDLVRLTAQAPHARGRYHGLYW